MILISLPSRARISALGLITNLGKIYERPTWSPAYFTIVLPREIRNEGSPAQGN